MLLSAVSGCTSVRRDVKSFASLRSDETVLTGRIELVPPLRPEEQHVDVISPYDYKNTAYIMLDDEPRAIQGEVTQADLEGSIPAEFGQLFTVAVESRPKFIVGAVIVLRIGRVLETAELPAGYWVDIEPGDKAAYLGTLRYYRNEFFDVQRLDVIDDFARDEAEFRAMLGGDHPLKKRLARPHHG
jgi:hypothetical protein